MGSERTRVNTRILSTLSVWQRYGLAVAVVLMVIALRFLLMPILGFYMAGKAEEAVEYEPPDARA